MRPKIQVTSAAHAADSGGDGVSITVMDWCRDDAVLGIARTTRVRLLYAPRMDSICEVGTPARMLMSSLSARALRIPSWPRIVETICGLQASRTTLAAWTPRRFWFWRMVKLGVRCETAASMASAEVGRVTQAMKRVGIGVDVAESAESSGAVGDVRIPWRMAVPRVPGNLLLNGT